jgi:hypothetical protein
MVPEVFHEVFFVLVGVAQNLKLVLKTMSARHHGRRPSSLLGCFYLPECEPDTVRINVESDKICSRGTRSWVLQIAPRRPWELALPMVDQVSLSQGFTDAPFLWARIDI